MREYWCLIKSHCEAPDYESSCIAESREEAMEIFASRIHWDIGEMENHVDEGVEINPELLDKKGE